MLLQQQHQRLGTQPAINFVWGQILMSIGLTMNVGIKVL
jgi:hypothetical protein